VRIIVVGDPHCKVSNLSESQKLIDFVLKTANEKKAQRVVFLGDLFNDHAVIRVEVLDFWKNAFNMLGHLEIFALVGNHDQVGSDEKSHYLHSLTTLNVNVIDKAVFDKDSQIGYAPYYKKNQDLIQASNELYKQGATKLLMAHQTFTGAQYENGFYDPTGLDPELISQESIISGHIHCSQQIGKCFYPGTPRWESVSDANEDKGIWLFEHNTDGSVLSKEFISTKAVVTPITKHIIYEGGETPELNPNHRNYLEFHGKAAWISQMKKQYKGLAQIKAKQTDRKMVIPDKSKIQNLTGFLESFVPIAGVAREEIHQYLTDLGK
jgi:DNA repair exonuclease SbcCD nuclease subunit